MKMERPLQAVQHGSSILSLTYSKYIFFFVNIFPVFKISMTAQNTTGFLVL